MSMPTCRSNEEHDDAAAVARCAARSADILDLHARAAAELDPDLRNDHFFDAAGVMAAAGAGDAALASLERIDDLSYSCLGHVDVALGLARSEHEATGPVAATAAGKLATMPADTVEASLRNELDVKLAAAMALSGDLDGANHLLDQVMPALAREVCAAARI